MKRFILAAAANLLLAPLAYAETYEFPSNRPVVQMSAPDDWDANETDTGMEFNSGDGAVYLSVDLAAPKKLEDVITDAVNYLDGEGVTIDSATEKSSEDKINGKDIFYVSWSGEDKDGPATIGLAVMVVDEKTALVFTYWGTKGEEDDSAAAVYDMLQSVKAAQ